MRNPFKPLSIVLLSLALSSCDYDKIDPEGPEVKDNVSFALDIQPILTSKCATCHNPTGEEPDFREGFAYESMEDLIEEGDIIPGDAEESELVKMLEGKSEDGNDMPPEEPLTPTQIALIKKWIDEGAGDN